MINPDASRRTLYLHCFYLDEMGIESKREVYTLIDSLGDIGGIIQIIMIIFGAIILPISSHSYYLQASRMMFFARSHDNSLFIKGDAEELKNENLA